MAKKSFGTVFKWGGSGGTAIGELYNVNPPELSIDTVETTNHNQADRLRTWIATLGNWSEVEIEMAMLAATIDALKTLLFNDAASWFISFEFGTTDITMAFTGPLVSLTPCKEAPVDGKYIMSAKIKPSGDITFAGIP